jgi:TIR domain
VQSADRTDAGHRESFLDALLWRLPKSLEPEYEAEQFVRALPQVRIAIVIGTALYAIFGILDLWMAKPQWKLLWVIRYAAVCPLGVAIYLWSFSRSFERIWQWLLSLLVTVAAIGIVTMIALIAPPGNYLYYGGLILIVIYNCTFLRLKFRFAFALSVLYFLMYVIVASFNGVEGPVLLNNSLMLFSAEFIALSANLTMERQTQRDFLLRRQLEQRRHELELKNAEILDLRARAGRKTRDVFISHSATDQAVADEVRDALEQRGMRVWIAPRDIVPGMPWDAAIMEGLRSCRLMVLVLSTRSNLSTQVMNEVRNASSVCVPVVPFRIEELQLSDALAYHISAAHWLDAVRPPFEDRVNELVAAVRLMLVGRETAKAPDEHAAPQ